MTDAVEVDELPDWTLERVDAEKMKVLALLLGDPNPLHFDPAVAPRLGVAPRQVNQGPSNMAMLVNMLRAAYPDATLRRLRVQLRGSVVAGQSVRAGGSVLDRTSDGDRQRIRAAVWLAVRNEHDGPETVVLAGEAELDRPVRPCP